MTGLWDAAFVVGPAAALLVLPTATVLLATRPRVRTKLVIAPYMLSGVSWLAWFVVWGLIFDFENTLVDTPSWLLVADGVSLIVCAASTVALVVTLFRALTRRTEATHRTRVSPSGA